MIAIVVSRADSTSDHIGEHLLAVGDWTAREDRTRPDEAGGGRYYRTDGFELRSFEEMHLDLDGVAAAFDDPDLLVFASRHAGDTGALLTAHFTGNFGPAEYGGEDGRLARACPNAHARVLAALADHAPAGYEVGMECTHHGPSAVGVPSMFVELGSGEEQWTDPKAARAVARAILDLDGVTAHRERQLVGFGGGHYAPRFTRIVRETDWAVGHVGSDWNLAEMGAPEANREVVAAAFERSGAEYAVVDGDRPDLETVVESLGYRVVTETWVREVDGVPLALAETVEGALCPVSEGLRFGADAGATPADADVEVATLPADLVDDASGVDAARTVNAVAAHTVAYETTENGNRVAERVAVTATARLDALLDALAALLAEKYESVERTADAVVANEVAFDPEKARRRGVDEGPAFGRLANGDSVTVDDETVYPEEVQTERTHRYPLR